MRRNILGAALATISVCATALALPSQNTRYTTEEKEVVDADREMNEASLRGDVTALDRIWAPDVIFLGVDGRVWNKAQRLEDFRSGNRVNRAQQTSEYSVRVFGLTGIVWFRSEIAASRDGRNCRTKDVLTRVYMKRDGQWRLVHQHAGAQQRDCQ